MGAPTPVYELLCPCGRDSSISQTLFLQICCTRDLHASEHCSVSFSGYCILNSCFSAVGDVAKQLCSACCRGQMLIFCVSCLSAINKGKKKPHPTVDNTGFVARLLMWEVIIHMTSVHRSKNKGKEAGKSLVSFAEAVSNLQRGLLGSFGSFPGKCFCEPLISASFPTTCHAANCN